MISCPRVIPFEELIIDWAIKLMEKVGKEELFKRKSLQQDMTEIDGLGNDENSQKLRAILQLNIVTKHIYNEHIKTLKILRAILHRIKDLDIDNEDAYAMACHRLIDGLED